MFVMGFGLNAEDVDVVSEDQRLEYGFFAGFFLGGDWQQMRIFNIFYLGQVDFTQPLVLRPEVKGVQKFLLLGP